VLLADSLLFFDLPLDDHAPSRTLVRLVIALLVGLLVTGVIVCKSLPAGAESRRALRRWLWTAAVAVVAIGAGYVAYVPSGRGYSPLCPGSCNRSNTAASIGIVVLIYSAAMLAGILLFRDLPHGRRWLSACVLVFVACLTVSYARRFQTDVQRWNRAYAVQARIFGTIDRLLPANLPKDATIYVRGYPADIRFGYPTIYNRWDLSGALQIRRNNPYIVAYPALRGTTVSCTRSSIVARNASSDDSLPHSGVFGSSYVIDVGQAAVQRITDRSSCLAAASAFE
jgi:hypothetical protein